MANKIIYFIGVLISSLLISSGTYAAVDIEVAYIFNTFSFLVCAFLVMWMAAGFCMLESGLVTTKSVSTIAAKNIGKFAIVSVMFYLVGYNLGYGNADNPYFGSFEIWTDNSSLETGYSDYSDWLFQTLFVCATCSIVSGAVAERIKIWPFFIFSAILGGFIYPIQMSWEWGGGWLDSLGFADFAGSTLVHACGGAAALAGVMILGPRLGRFTDDRSPQNMAPFAASSFFSKRLSKIGFRCKILEFKEKNFKPVKNLYARIGNKSPNFCFAGHLDVVPPGNLADWSINPFNPKVKNNHLLGRGANDMKSSIACFTSAASIFLKENK